MTTSALIAMVRKFVSYDLDIYQGVNATDADIVEALNNSIQDLGLLCKLRESSIPITLTAISPAIFNVGDYSCTPREFIRVSDVIISGNMLYNCAGNDYGPWSEQELERRYPTWRTDPAGTPFAFVWFGNSQIILYPPPSSAVAALATHFLSGQVLPLPLDASVPTGVPLLPGRLHESLARHAAARSAKSHATESQQLARINAMRLDAETAADAEGRRNDNASAAWGSTSGARTKNHLRL